MKFKKIAALLLAFMLAACTAPTEATLPPSATPTATATPIPTATATPLPTLPPEIKTSLEQRFGEELVITSGDGVNTATIADRQVAVTINNEWVVLPEDSATRHVPPDAQLIINNEGKAVLFGAGTPLYQWNSEAKDWVLDMSTVDVRQFSAWAYDLAYQQFGDPAQTKIPVGQYYSLWYLRQPEVTVGNKGVFVDYSIWFEGIVEVTGSSDPGQELALVSWLRKDNQGRIVRELGLGWAKIAGEAWQARAAIFSVASPDIWAQAGDLSGWKEILGKMVGKNAEVSIIGPFHNPQKDLCETESFGPEPTCGLSKWYEAALAQDIDFSQIIQDLSRGKALQEELIHQSWIVRASEEVLE